MKRSRDALGLATLAAIGLGFLARRGRWEPARLAYAFLIVALLASPVVFPWYLVGIAPFVAMMPSGFTIAWITAAPLTYEVIDTFDATQTWEPANWPLVAIGPESWIIAPRRQYRSSSNRALRRWTRSPRHQATPARTTKGGPMATEEKTHRHQRRSTLQQGAFAGIIAGIIFGLMEIVGAVAMGMPALMPLRMFASIILGSAALEDVALGTAAIVGIIVHLVLSGVFGAIYGLLNARADTETQTSMGRQAGLGLVFGFAVWLVNFHIIARLLYPWFLGTPQFLQMMLHVVFFGLPLALLFAYRERRIHGAAQMPRAA